MKWKTEMITEVTLGALHTASRAEPDRMEADSLWKQTQKSYVAYTLNADQAERDKAEPNRVD